MKPRSPPQQQPPTQRKPCIPIAPGLRNYLRRYKRDRTLSATYERLHAFSEVIPLVDADGVETLWDTVIYPHEEMPELTVAVVQVAREVSHS